MSIARPAVMPRATVTLVLALTSVLLVGATPAVAAVDPVPQDVQAAFSEQALAYLRSTSQTTVDVGNMGDAGVPDFTAAASFGDPHLIYGWSAAMIAGDATANPITSIGEWTAPFMTADGVMLGTCRVWRPPAQAGAEMAGYNNDVELAESLAGMPSDAYLVHDAPTGSWFSLKDGTVTPLGHLAIAQVPQPMSVEQVAPIVAKRYADAVAGGPGARQARLAQTTLWLLIGGAIVLIAAATTAVVVAGRRRRRAI